MLKNLLSDTLKYGLGKVIVKFFSILVVPIIAKNFPPDIFGEINIVNTFIGLFTGITILGFDSAVGYYYYHGEEELRRDYLGTSFLIRMIISIIIFIIIFVLAKTLSGANFLLKDSNRYLLIILGAALIPFDNSMNFFIDLTRYIIKPVIYNISNLSKIILYYAFISLFLLTGLTIEKIFISMLMSSAIPVIFLFFHYRKMLNFKINLYCLKKLLKYGIPLIPASLMFWFMGSANRLVLNAYTTLEDSGIFSMMNSVSGIFLLITSSIMTAWPPYSMIIAKQSNAHELFAKITTLLLLFLIPLAFFFWSISDVIILLFSKPVYLQGENTIILIIMQHILNLLYYCVAIGLTLKEKTIYITIGYSIAGILTILISLPLCKYFGIFGAAFSGLIGYLASVLYIAFKSNQFYPIPYKTRIIFIYSFVLTVTLCFALFSSGINILKNFIVRFFLGCIFAIIPFMVKLVSVSDIKDFFRNNIKVKD
jgi:O-antigen/teichoic acid export membrane protein